MDKSAVFILSLRKDVSNSNFKDNTKKIIINFDLPASGTGVTGLSGISIPFCTNSSLFARTDIFLSNAVKEENNLCYFSNTKQIQKLNLARDSNSRKVKRRGLNTESRFRLPPGEVFPNSILVTSTRVLISNSM